MPLKKNKFTRHTTNENIMKSLKNIIVIGLVAIFALSLGSCTKCDEAEADDTFTGIINKSPSGEDIYIYGYNGFMNGGNMITGNHEFASVFEVSFDGGVTRQAIDYNLYTVVGNPMTVNCEVSFDRSVLLNSIGNTVDYHVTATSCNACDEKRTISNWVLINAVPAGFSLNTTQEEIIVQ